MRFKTLFKLGLISFLVFVTLGDRFLPKPLNHASCQTRTSINQFLINMFPDIKFEFPHEKLEKAIEKLQKGAESEEE